MYFDSLHVYFRQLTQSFLTKQTNACKKQVQHIRMKETCNFPTIFILKMAAFWDTALCSLTALMMEAVQTPETRSTSTRLHGAISQKAVIFLLAAVRTSNLTILILTGRGTSLVWGR
jgi:hypothetical protein